MYRYSKESKLGGVDCATACGVKNTNTDVTNTNARLRAQTLLAILFPIPNSLFCSMKLLKDDQMLFSSYFLLTYYRPWWIRSYFAKLL